MASTRTATLVGLFGLGGLTGAVIATLFDSKKSDKQQQQQQHQQQHHHHHHHLTPTKTTATGVPAPPAPGSTPSPPGAASNLLDTDLLDRRLLARAAQAAGGAIEASGYPGPVSDLLVNTAYVAGYDRRLRHPSWVACHMTAESLLKVPPPPGTPPPPRADRSNSVFKEDPRIPDPFRAHLADYFRSGYDRGHMVAAADAKFSQQAMDETFYLTNIAPQVGEGFNRDYWAHTEDFVRRLTGQFRDIYCFTVPLYLPKQDPDGKWRVSYEVIGSPPSVGVPTHFAKVVLGVGKPGSDVKGALPSSSTTHLTPRGLAGNLAGEKWVGLGAFVIPNARVSNDTPLKSFVVPVEAVERASGLNLFPPTVKTSSKQLCNLVSCDIIVRDFSDANRRAAGMQRSNSAPAGLGK